jgi:hypothetical protein
MSNSLPTPIVGEVEAEPERERLNRFARLITNLFNPATLALPALAMGVYVSHVPGAWRFAVLYMLVAVLVPLADLSWQLSTGRVSDFHLAQRHERRRPFLIGTLCTAVALLLYQALGAPEVLIAMAQATLLISLVLFVITLHWQISVHLATIAGVVTFALLAFGVEALAFVLLIPLVGWARVHLRRHTAAQVVAGTIVGVTAMLVCMAGVLY